ncbi:hypothetical protein HPP92_004261, partial [Vanilla planifolia]
MAEIAPVGFDPKVNNWWCCHVGVNDQHVRRDEKVIDQIYLRTGALSWRTDGEDELDVGWSPLPSHDLP